jgi:hypothetical protein
VSLGIEYLFYGTWEIAGAMAMGHHPDSKIRGACLSDKDLEFEHGVEKSQILKGRVDRVWVVERDTVYPQEWDFELVSCSEDEPGARAVTAINFDGRSSFKTLAEWEDELEDKLSDEQEGRIADSWDEYIWNPRSVNFKGIPVAA